MDTEQQIPMTNNSIAIIEHVERLKDLKLLGVSETALRAASDAVDSLLYKLKAVVADFRPDIDDEHHAELVNSVGEVLPTAETVQDFVHDLVEKASI